MNCIRAIKFYSNLQLAPAQTNVLSTLLTAALATTLLSATFTQRVEALEFKCEIPGDVRYLRMEIPGADKLCEVTVNFEQSGESKTMWHAQSDTLFCSARAYELRDKYINQWGYTCSDMPDRDGVDGLSSSQRLILDSQLKKLIARGAVSETPYKVTGVKVVASTPLDKTAGLLAFQYFFDSNIDSTEIIIDEGSSWRVMTTLDTLSTQIDTESPVTSALVHAISDTGALEVHTTVIDGPLKQECFGSQVLSISASGQVTSKAPHRFVCHEDISNEADKG